MVIGDGNHQKNNNRLIILSSLLIDCVTTINMKLAFQYFKRKGGPQYECNDDDDDILLGNTDQGSQSLLVNDYLTTQPNNSFVTNHHTSSNNYDFNNESSSSSGNNGQSTRRGYLKSSTLSYRLMKMIGNILAVVTLISFLILVPWITAHAMIYDKARPDFAAFYSAGAFVLITVAMSTKLIYNHLTNWYMPDVQKYVVRILYMVPIYSIQSLLSLRFHNARLYIDLVRDLYEAYVIQSFLYYLIELLGGEDTLSQKLQEKDQHYGDHPPFPQWIYPSWEMGFEFMIKCKHGVLQYVVAKIFAALITATLEPIGLFNEGEFDWTKGYVYVSFIINLSQMWALYCLVKFYHATSDNLVNWHPLGKFLCIKGVVFFTWWQGVLIVMLENKGLIKDVGNWDKDDVANGLQDYLICVEMFCFAIAHSFTYTHNEYLPNHNGGIRSDSNQSLQGNAFEEDGDGVDIAPPIIRTLDTPMGFRDAFWSSTLPNDTFDEIKRTIGTGISDQGSSNDVRLLRNVSMMHAESI